MESGIILKRKLNPEVVATMAICINSPIALLVGTKALKEVTIIKFDGSSWTQDINLHWVTVTELNIDEASDTVKMKISTWGGWAEIDLDEYLGELIYSGLLYFE